MDSVFFQSILVRPPVIMGRKLRPFSLFHALVLMQFDSSHLNGQKVTIDELVFSVFVCGLEYPQGVDYIFSIKAIKDCAKWGKKSKKKYDYSESFEEFRQYLLDYMRFPGIYETTSASGQSLNAPKKSNIPWPFKVAADIMNKYPGFTEKEVWNMPVIKASTYRAHIAEDNGWELENEEITERIKAAGLEWKGE